MIRLSVVIITFNEESNIARCLESVKDIADEIVVVDSFSTDKTESICRKNGVKFIQHPFKGHIQQKNFAITQASNPHILSLDADEAIDSVLKEEILKVKKNWQYDGYYMNRLTNYCGKWVKHCGWYPDRKLRLWDSRKGSWTGINPHDRYEMQDGATSSRLRGDILHYSYGSISQHLKQINYFTDIAAETLYKSGRKASFFNLTVSPLFKFLRDYLIKLGFLDGITGFFISAFSAYATFAKYAKLKMHWMRKKD